MLCCDVLCLCRVVKDRLAFWMGCFKWVDANVLGLQFQAARYLRMAEERGRIEVGGSW